MGFFEKLSDSLAKTRKNLAFAFGGKIDDDFYDALEEQLILCDAGGETASLISATAREKIESEKIMDLAEAQAVVTDIVAGFMRPETELALDKKPCVILMIGVNGAGKTTTAGKLANLFKKQGKSVLLAAADTFRAAAVEQLCIWGERSGVDVIKNTQGSDAAAVIFDAVSAAKSRGTDIVICDTAGRLHNKKNLMDELSKMARIINKACDTASVETLLVLDGVTGQNAINQARDFADASGVSGIVLTKLDGTAKGGSVIAVKHSLGIPVRYIGVGEGIDDIAEFDENDFAKALFVGTKAV